MLGGGTFITQNKILPGSYINFVNANTGSVALGDRGSVAIALPLGAQKAGEVITVTANEFITKPDEVLGADVPANTTKVLKDLFKHALVVYIFNTTPATEGGTAATASAICAALESYDFNILAAYTNVEADVSTYIAAVKNWRDTYGKKCQAVVWNGQEADTDYEGVINVVNKVTDADADQFALVAWTAGAEAACAVNASCTNMVYDGYYTVETPHTQAELETCIKEGKLAFHVVYGKVRVLEDINGLVTTDVDKGDDFKSNQTIRVCDQIANDIAYLFNTRYLGVIPNDAGGRTSLWGDIVKHHRQLESIRAIENFDSALLTVEQGDTKKSVVINDVITVVNAMSQLYMTVVVQ